MKDTSPIMSGGHVRYYNPDVAFTKRTLERHIFADTGILTQKDVEKILIVALDSLRELYPTKEFKSGFIVNVRSKTQDDELLGDAFIWIEDF